MIRRILGATALIPLMSFSLSSACLGGTILDPQTYRDGFAEGYSVGYDFGLATGTELGERNGTAKGKSEGFQTGWDETYGPAYDKAYDIKFPRGIVEGYSIGIEDGFAEGLYWAPVILATVDPSYGGSVGVWGSGITIRSGAIHSGTLSFGIFDSHLSLNENGALDLFKLGYDNGYASGETQGSKKGYDLIFPRAYKIAYRTWYPQGKREGRDQGKLDGAEDGFSNGWDTGYDGGFDDGFFAGVHYQMYGTAALPSNAFAFTSPVALPEPTSTACICVASVVGLMRPFRRNR